MSSSWFAVQRFWPWGRFAQQLHFIPAAQPLYRFRNGQRNFGIAAAFAALGAIKVYVHANDPAADQIFAWLVKKSLIDSTTPGHAMAAG